MAARNTRSTARKTEQPAADAGTLEADLTPAKTLADFAAVDKVADVPADGDVEALKAADAEAGKGVADDSEQHDDTVVQDEPSDEEVQELRKSDEERQAELQRFVTGDIKSDDEIVEEAAQVDTSDAAELDGDNLAVVLFDYFRVKLPENRTHTARKGDVIKVSDKVLKRGVELGGLQEIEG